MSKLGPEDRIQLAILDYLEAALPQAMVWHTPNGGGRSLFEGAKLKRLGVTRGVPDLAMLPGDGRIYFFEVKAPKGRVSPDQRKWGQDAQARGAGWAVVYSVDDVRSALKAWCIKTREVAA